MPLLGILLASLLQASHASVHDSNGAGFLAINGKLGVKLPQR